MGEPVVKASGRTFNAISTYVPNPHWSSLLVKSTHSLKMSIQPPSEALKSGLPMPVYATVRSTLNLFSPIPGDSCKGGPSFQFTQLIFKVTDRIIDSIDFSPGPPVFKVPF